MTLDACVVPTAAILGITLLASIWILQGHDNLTLAAASALIAGIAGYVIPSPFQKKE